MKDNNSNTATEQNVGKNSSRRRKIALWLLFILLLAGVVGFGVWYFQSDLKYNNDVKFAFNRTIDNLDGILANRWGTYGALKKRKITYVRFNEPAEYENAEGKFSTIEIFAQGVDERDVERKFDGFFRVPEKYYNALITAEKNNNIKVYVQTLEECFSTMLGITYESSSCDLNLPFAKQQADEFNELFNLSTADTDKNIQNRGFLPQYIKVIDDVQDEGTWRKATFVMKGLSFVEVEGEGGLGTAPRKKSNAIMSEYNKNKLQVYETDFSFVVRYDYSSLRGPEEWLDIILEEFFSGDTSRLVFQDVTVTRFVCANSALGKMLNNVFDFE